MVQLISVALFAGLLGSAKALTWVNFPTKFQVGVEVTLQWTLEPGENAERIIMQHEKSDGHGAYQYETIIEWTHGTGVGVTSICWIPNVPGPSFRFETWSSSAEIIAQIGTQVTASPQFIILAADGSYVGELLPTIDIFSNITPQTITGVWYPNAPPGCGFADAPTTAAAATSVDTGTPRPAISTPTPISNSVETVTPPPTITALAPSSTFLPSTNGTTAIIHVSIPSSVMNAVTAAPSSTCISSTLSTIEPPTCTSVVPTTTFATTQSSSKIISSPTSSNRPIVFTNGVGGLKNSVVVVGLVVACLAFSAYDIL